jgi:hypothetical protein
MTNKPNQNWLDNFLKELEAMPPSERPWAVTKLCLSRLSEELQTVIWKMAEHDYFDAQTIAVACPEIAEQSEKLYLQLQELSFVEEFPHRGHNLHELTREQLLRHTPCSTN